MQTIFDIIDQLPDKNMTTRILGVLDWVVPGQWTNLTGFENTVSTISGETDPELLQKIGDRVIALYNDPSQGYQRAMWLFQKVDAVQGIAGKVALVNKIGESVHFLSFLDRITPKADTVQALDFAIKVITEVITFCQINGIPGNSVPEFVESLTDRQDEGLMRMAALICFDGLIPLGPEFIDKLLDRVTNLDANELQQNERFKNIAGSIPPEVGDDHVGFIRKSVASISGYMGNFVQEHNLSVENVAGSLQGILEGAESKLDYVAAFLDITTNYFEHTGAQSIMRALVYRAMAEI